MQGPTKRGVGATRGDAGRERSEGCGPRFSCCLARICTTIVGFDKFWQFVSIRSAVSPLWAHVVSWAPLLHTKTLFATSLTWGRSAARYHHRHSTFHGHGPSHGQSTYEGGGGEASSRAERQLTLTVTLHTIPPMQHGIRSSAANHSYAEESLSSIPSTHARSKHIHPI